ncbi:MAG: DUF2945 domain-containing protein [Stellaceae bacterium]
MTDHFNVGDPVSWNSEAGRVCGTIVRVHTRDIDVKRPSMAERDQPMPTRRPACQTKH